GPVCSRISTHRVLPGGGSFHSHTTDDGPLLGAGVAHARCSDPAGAVVDVVALIVVEVVSCGSVVELVGTVVGSWTSLVDVVVVVTLWDSPVVVLVVDDVESG